MQKITFLTLAILAGVSLSTWAAQAQDGRPAKPAFDEVDADGDGAITPGELRAYAMSRGEARFADTDTDGDGLLSRDEIVTGAADRAGARADRMIAALDSDDDGLLSVEEVAARPEGRRGHGGQRGGERRGAGMFDRADADDDGALSAGEWAAMGPRGGRGRD